jgi:tRNA nucleotidyltransferase/poly(A) polymerase
MNNEWLSTPRGSDPLKHTCVSFLFSELRRVTSDLHQSEVTCCLVGGLGTSVYVDPGTTKDIDMVVSVTGEEQADRLKNFLLSRGTRPNHHRAFT